METEIKKHLDNVVMHKLHGSVCVEQERIINGLPADYKHYSIYRLPLDG